MRGEYLRGDGACLPNTLTRLGEEVLMRNAVGLSDDPDWYLALANCVPSLTLQLEDLNEPTIGVNGYTRIAVPRTSAGWDSVGRQLGVFWTQTAIKTWLPVGGAFSGPMTRVALVNHPTATVGDLVISLSAALAAPLLMTPATPESERSFRYRLYAK